MRGVPTKTPERVAEAKRLRDEGWTLREVANHFGIKHQTVSSWLTDPDGSVLRARKARYAGTCIECGGRVSGQGGIVGRSLRCRDCGSRLGTTKGAAANAARAAAKYQRIAELWREGMTLGEIAEAVGTTPGTIGVVIYRLRSRGWDLPYRQRIPDRRVPA